MQELPNTAQGSLRGNRTVLSKAEKSRSSPFFQTSRVESCSYVAKARGGFYHAIPFRLSTKKSYASNMAPSSEIYSLGRYFPVRWPSIENLRCFCVGLRGF
jgi:hypothetical protein